MISKCYEEKIYQMIAREVLYDRETKIRTDKLNKYKKIFKLDLGKIYKNKGDGEFSREQKKELCEFWNEYNFLYEFDYDSVYPYYLISGKFDCRYIPLEFMETFIRPNLFKESYRLAFQDKAYLHKLMPDVKQPENIIMKVESLYYDQGFQQISMIEAIELCLEALEKGEEIVLKPNTLYLGKGIKFYKKLNKLEIEEILKKSGDNFVIQKSIKQHPIMKKLNESTVNTLRLTTLMLNGEIIPLAALVKVGSKNGRTDHFHHGGIILGVDLEGNVSSWGLNGNLQKVTELPSGIKLGVNGEFKKVPCFDKAVKLAVKAHLHIPVIKMLSWDIAIDEENEAEIIEGNVGGDITIHQAVTGPIFGEYTMDVLKSYCTKYIHEKNDLFDYSEFANYIKIDRYVGDNSIVNIPETINGKACTIIGISSFEGNNNIKKIILPNSIKFIQLNAFNNCRQLECIEGDFSKIKCAGNAFDNCIKLEKSNLCLLK